MLSRWVGEIQLCLDSCLMVNKERPEQALGSQMFMYFCQVQMLTFGRSRNLWQLLVSACWVCVPAQQPISVSDFVLCRMGILQETLFLSERKLSTDPKEQYLLHIIAAYVSVCINALLMVFSVPEFTTWILPSRNTLLCFGKQSNDPIFIK